MAKFKLGLFIHLSLLLLLLTHLSVFVKVEQMLLWRNSQRDGVVLVASSSDQLAYNAQGDSTAVAHQIFTRSSFPSDFAMAFDDMCSTAATMKAVPTSQCNYTAAAVLRTELRQKLDLKARQEELEREFDESLFVLTEEELVVKNSSNFILLKDFRFERRKGLVAGGVARFQNAFVQNSKPIVFDCSMVYVPETCKSASSTKSNFDVHKIVDPNRVERIDTAVLIYQLWGNNYFHSLIHSLPRLMYILGFLQSNPNTTILASPTLCNFSPTLNQILGIRNAWVPYNAKKTYFVRNLLVPQGTPCGFSPPKPLRELQTLIDQYVHKNFPDSDVNLKRGKPKLIVVQERTSRGLLNHAQLVESLEQRFGTFCQIHIFTGKESFLDTILLHHAADIVVGPHGAGLSNILFCGYTSNSTTKEGGPCGMVELHPTYGRDNGPVGHCHQMTAQSLRVEARLLVQTDGSRFEAFHGNISEAVSAVEPLLLALQHKYSS